MQEPSDVKLKKMSQENTLRTGSEASSRHKAGRYKQDMAKGGVVKETG
jgi:hypothetical protein